MRTINGIGLFLCLSGTLAASAARADHFISVCARQQPFQDFLTEQLAKPCDSITAADLAALTRVAADYSELSTVTRDDVANLPNLEILNITGNPLTAIPDGLLADLPKLKTLVMFGTLLTELPADLLDHNPDIVNLHLFDNPFTTIPEPVLERILAAPGIKVIDLSEVLEDSVKQRLRYRFPENGLVELTFY